MVSQGASLGENNGWGLLLFLDYLPPVYLDSALAIVKADCVTVFENHELFLEGQGVRLRLGTCLWLGAIVIFVPVKINALATELFELIIWVKKGHFHVVREHKYVTQNMVVVIVPDILICKRHNCFFFDNVDYFETLFLEISSCDELFTDTERLAISTDGIVNC